ncbi:MAG: PliI family lysozyme inhibitor of I-type lysozyme [Ignavibacteria bacterium]
MRIVIALIFVTFLCGCGKKDDIRTADKIVENKMVINEYKTKSGKGFQVISRKLNASLSDILVVGAGFENFRDTIKFMESEPFNTAFLADLNNDGFEELYIITKSSGSGSYLNIHGISSNKDKSYSLIAVQTINEKDLNEGKDFFGYMGHDKITAEKDALMREFPVYKQGDTNDKPTGGNRKVYYKLSAGENSYQLKVAPNEVSK